MSFGDTDRTTRVAQGPSIPKPEFPVAQGHSKNWLYAGLAVLLTALTIGACRPSSVPFTTVGWSIFWIFAVLLLVVGIYSLVRAESWDHKYDRPLEAGLVIALVVIGVWLWNSSPKPLNRPAIQEAKVTAPDVKKVVQDPAPQLTSNAQPRQPADQSSIGAQVHNLQDDVSHLKLDQKTTNRRIEGIKHELLYPLKDEQTDTKRRIQSFKHELIYPLRDKVAVLETVPKSSPLAINQPIPRRNQVVARSAWKSQPTFVYLTDREKQLLAQARRK
ncbi:MAG: DUF308 domain-containing protein [Candidatus Doudnabacteria bacterium]|nr:DUF308 domain-containing protein [Candidatus Doudnabacteria bacterium]